MRAACSWGSLGCARASPYAWHAPQVARQRSRAPARSQRRAGFRATLAQSSFLFFLLVCDHVASSAHAPSEGHDAQARTHSVKARAPVAPF